MPIAKFARSLLVATLAILATCAAYGQQCGNYEPGVQPSINSIGGVDDGQGSSYQTAQVCNLAPGASVVLQLVVQDGNTGNTLLTAQAPTDVNGVAFFNVTSITMPGSPPDPDFLFVTSPANPNLRSYSTEVCLNCSNSNFLVGPLIFQFQGTTVDGSQPIQIVGTFLTNDAGVITSGEADINSGTGVFQKVPLSGSYTFNEATGAGAITLATPFGKQSFTFNGTQEGALVTSGGPLAGTGTLAQMTTEITAVPYFIYGSYSTELSGTLPCDSACRLTGGRPETVASTGIFCLACQPAAQPDSAPLYSFLSDLIVNGQSSLGLTQSGTVGPLDSFSRLVLTDTASRGSATPTHYAGYLVSAFEMYLISLDPQDQRAAVSGIATQVNP